MIEVQPGDTLYGLSRRHQVSLSELTSLNGLNNPNLKPGQKLYLPAAGASSDRSTFAAARAVEEATPSTAPHYPAAADAGARNNASHNGTYTVRPGDSLYGIARSNNVKYAELQQVNGISDPTRVKPGTVLKIPGGSAPEAPPVQEAPARVAAYTPEPPPAAAEVAAVEEPSSRPHRAEAAAAPREPSATGEVPPIIPSPPARYGEATTMQPTVINGEKRVAALSENKMTDASPDVPDVPAVQPAAAPPPAPPVEKPAVAEKPVQAEEKVAVAVPAAVANSAGNTGKLRWPVSGKIIAGFGGRPDGTHNDGINLQVPLGTEVHAAESGVVAYAGSELKGYGNLVLLRHDNGWVTAYAYNDELLVKRGDKIKRGQVIAKAGKTGAVDQPQVHFELRQGSKPVDPMPYLERL